MKISFFVQDSQIGDLNVSPCKYYYEYHYLYYYSYKTKLCYLRRSLPRPCAVEMESSLSLPDISCQQAQEGHPALIHSHQLLPPGNA